MTKKLHRQNTWTVQLYSPGGSNLHFHLTHASLDPPKSTLQTTSRSVQLILHSSRHRVAIHYNRPLIPSPQNCPLAWGIWTPVQHMVPWAHLSPQPEWHLNQFSGFCRNHNNDNNNLICIASECQRLQRRWRTESTKKNMIVTDWI